MFKIFFFIACIFFEHIIFSQDMRNFLADENQDINLNLDASSYSSDNTNLNTNIDTNSNNSNNNNTENKTILNADKSNSPLDSKDKSVKKVFKISLSQAILKAKKSNEDFAVLDMKKRNKETEFRMKKIYFFLPLDASFAYNLSSTETIYSFDKKNTSSYKRFADEVKSSITLSIGSDNYSIFDFFNSSENFKKEEIDYLLEILAYNNDFRDKILNILISYFKLKIYKDSINNFKTYLIMSKAYVNLLHTKFKKGLISESDLNLAKQDMESQQLKKQEIETNYSKELATFNGLLGNSSDQDYKYITELDLQKDIIFLNPKEINKSINQAPEIIKAELNLKKAELELRRSFKSNMPLPSLKTALAFTQGYSNSATSFTETSGIGSSGSKNVDVTLNVSLNWTLYSKDGFLNTEQIKNNKIQLETKKLELKKTLKDTQNQANSLYQELRSKIKQINDIEKYILDLSNSYQVALKELEQDKIDVSKIILLFKDYVEKEEKLNSLKIEYIDKKVELIKLLALDNFLGVNY